MIIVIFSPTYFFPNPATPWQTQGTTHPIECVSPDRPLNSCLLCPSWFFVRSPRLTCHRCPLSAWLRTTLHQCGAAPDPGGSSWPARDVYLTCLKTHTSYFVSPDQPTCYQAPFVPFLDHFLAIIPLPSHVIMARLAGCNLRR